MWYIKNIIFSELLLTLEETKEFGRSFVYRRSLTYAEKKADDSTF